MTTCRCDLPLPPFSTIFVQIQINADCSERDQTDTNTGMGLKFYQKGSSNTREIKPVAGKEFWFLVTLLIWSPSFLGQSCFSPVWFVPRTQPWGPAPSWWVQSWNHGISQTGKDPQAQSFQMLGQLHQPNATLNIIILCRISPLYAVLVILGISLKLGQVIAALIANVSEMSFMSSLDLGCLSGNWGTLFFPPLDTKPQISQLCRSAGIWVSSFFVFSFSLLFLFISCWIESLVKNSNVICKPTAGSECPSFSNSRQVQNSQRLCVPMSLPPRNPIPHLGITA